MGEDPAAASEGGGRTQEPSPAALARLGAAWGRPAGDESLWFVPDPGGKPVPAAAPEELRDPARPGAGFDYQCHTLDEVPVPVCMDAEPDPAVRGGDPARLEPGPYPGAARHDCRQMSPAAGPAAAHHNPEMDAMRGPGRPAWEKAGLISALHSKVAAPAGKSPGDLRPPVVRPPVAQKPPGTDLSPGGSPALDDPGAEKRLRKEQPWARTPAGTSA